MFKISSLVVCVPSKMGLLAENRSKKLPFLNEYTTKVEKMSRTADRINRGKKKELRTNLIIVRQPHFIYSG